MITGGGQGIWREIALALVNNAGLNIDQAALVATVKSLSTIIDTLVNGLSFCTQFVARYVHRQGCGATIKIGLISQETGRLGRTVHAASKLGVGVLTESLALVFAYIEISVNAVAYILTLSPPVQRALADSAFRKDALREAPMGRLATSCDVAGALL